MKKIMLMTILMLLSHQSSASLMQLNYSGFGAPASPTNYPVDSSGVVSFSFDDATADADPSASEGSFVNPLINGFMFLGGIQYEIDIAAGSQMSSYPTYNDRLKTTGFLVNQQLGHTRSFLLDFGGTLAATAGHSLKNIIEECYDLYLIVTDPTTVVGSAEYNAAYQSYSGGRLVTSGAQAAPTTSTPEPIVSVAEPSAIILLLLGVAGVVVSRKTKVKNL